MEIPSRSAALGLAAVLLFWSASPLSADPATSARLADGFGRLPLYFIENRGQIDPRVAYYVQGSDKTIYFTAQGLTFALNGPAERWVLELDFIGARAGARPEGQEPTGARFSYFRGARSQWHAGLESYSRIVYRDLWPGIDLVYSGTVNRMKHTFRVKPGADPDRIRLAWRGASNVKLNDAGELVVTTPSSVLTDERPVSWQEDGGRRVEVATKYRLSPAVYGFEVADYDRSRELVIDPAVLMYAGFIGGSCADASYGIAVDNAGNVYVTGFVASDETSFPVTAGPDLTFNGVPCGIISDALVAKVNADGTALVYAGFIGGSNHDAGSGIAVDSTGNAYITGITGSDQTSFPVTVGPDLTYNDGSYLGSFDAFVAKVNADGTALEYCGYIGGGSQDFGEGIAVDSSANAYVTGFTKSDQTGFPVTAGPDLTFNGLGDAFVAKVAANGAELLYAGYIGGNLLDTGFGIAVDSAANAYVTGYTRSDQMSFPVTIGPDLTFNYGVNDAFVAKLDASGTEVLYAGYVGGDYDDTAEDIAVDGAGNAYIIGYTTSGQTSFPVKAGPDLTFNGLSDAFVAKVSASGADLLYAGYIGGYGHDSGVGIAVDTEGNAYVTGVAQSDEASFPVTAGPDLTFNGGFQDAFVAKLNPSGTGLLYAGYIGGTGFDVGRTIAVDSAGNAYITGMTDSDETGFPVTAGPDLTANGDLDAFVAKIVTAPPPQEQITGLIAQINALVAAGKLDAGTAGSMIYKLQSAADYFSAGKVERACGQIVDFIKKVNEKVNGGKLAPADGQPLTRAAALLQATIGCQGLPAA